MTYINNFISYIVNPLIEFMFAAALVYFVFGVILFIRDANSEDGRATGKQHLLWGIVGLAIMVSVYGILSIVDNSVKGSGSGSSVISGGN